MMSGRKMKINWQPYITHLSASQIKTLLANPRRWALEKLIKLPTTTSAAATTGRMIHEAIESYMAGSPIDDEHELAKHVLSALVENGQLEKLRQSHGVFVEHPFQLSATPELPPIQGYIDVLVDNYYWDCPLIIDHKTSKSRRYFLTVPEMKNDIQLMIYAYYALLRSDAIGVFIQHNQLAYSLKKQPLVVRRTYVCRERVFKFIEQLQERIITTLNTVLKMWDMLGKLPMSDLCSECNCANRFGPNSCEFAPICQGKISAEEYRTVYGTVSKDLGLEELTTWEVLEGVDRFVKRKEFPVLTINQETSILKVKKEEKMIELSVLVGKARPQVSHLPSVWDRREAVTAAVVKHVVDSGVMAVVAPSHFVGGSIDPDYLPIISQLVEKGVKIYLEV